MAHSDDLTVLKSVILANSRLKLLLLGYVHYGSLYEAVGNKIAIAARCYRSMRKSETPHKSKMIVADNCSRMNNVSFAVRQGSYAIDYECSER
jgi:hypothetical protein